MVILKKVILIHYLHSLEDGVRIRVVYLSGLDEYQADAKRSVFVYYQES